MTTATNDVRSRITLIHKGIGTIEFAWDEGEIVVVCFSPNVGIPYWLSCGVQLHYDQGVSVGKEKAREIWNEFIRQGWKEKP